ncbi:hypothetical protein DEA06_15905 [Microbacterium sp. Gd 4-13]|uniref:glycosyltransferase family 4 protein n=1 Tax=Microbacterium sp. Gd 4-13 TaxID=2173179 RepID=UPI000D56732C|nr:glycosyltransferase family 4 protein [Microbacterium sp. Gd 4-13]PVW02159.1 hypothetical protein DEA06_15905 [Microbacterium sp. Gd 4-13]
MHWILVGKEAPGTKTGGLNRYVEGFAPAMRHAGVEVTEVFLGSVESGQGSSGLARIWRSFLLGIRTKGVDVIDSHFAMYGMPFVMGALLRARLRAVQPPVVVVHFHGPWGDESAIASRTNRSIGLTVKRGMERWVLGRAAVVVVLTKVFAQEAARTGADPSKIAIIPPGVGEFWSQRSSEPVDEGSVKLLCVRRLTERMGHERLIRMLHTMNFRVDGRAVCLEVVGTGELESHLKSVTQGLGRSDSVRFHGRLSDIELRAIAHTCTAAVVPTLALEGFGLVVLEAMAMGLPVISTGQGGLSEAMGPWARVPFLFSLQEPDSLHAAVRAVSIPGRATLGHEVREYALRHTWEQVARRTLDTVSTKS